MDKTINSSQMSNTLGLKPADKQCRLQAEGGSGIGNVRGYQKMTDAKKPPFSGRLSI
ncbi:hypothetical protein ACET8J_19280 [Aeromonas veronii]|uniref:hypothetical protein n=1 Tax=Aeromonas TaxID=642 RepID=UPI0013A69A3D|nr:hypothetical protein [Aeromonas veronii]MBL0479422.1 hypothetical protein [Aeromonas veronii]